MALDNLTVLCERCHAAAHRFGGAFSTF